MQKISRTRHGNWEFDRQYFQWFFDKSGNLDRTRHTNWFEGWFRFISRYVNLSVSPKSEVLEIGCGVGSFCRVLQNKGFKVIGTDISDFILEKAKQTHPSVHFRRLDVEREISLPEKFNYVFALEVMEHLHNPNKALRNVYKILKPEGMFIFSTPSISKQSLQDPTHINVHNPDWWIKKGKKVGFKSFKYKYATLLPWFYRIHQLFSIIIPIRTDIRLISSTCIFFFKK